MANRSGRFSTFVFNGKKHLLHSIFFPDDDQERVVFSVETFLETVRASAGAASPLLIFDQLEEWITLFEESPAGHGLNEAQSSQAKKQNAIISIINNIALPVKVFISLREDYLAKLTPFFQRCPSLPDQYLRLNPLGSEQIYKAIYGPFERFQGRYRPELTSELAREIQGQFKERSGASDIRLTEVQIVCQSLFESGKEGKDLERFFTEQGGVKGILEHYLEHLLESLPVGHQEPAVALMTRMVTSAGTRNVICRDDLLRRVELEDEIQPEVLAEALDNLEQNTKLLRRERRREVYFYEIASEFLVEWIRKKAQDRQRLMDKKKLEEAQRRIEEQARTANLLATTVMLAWTESDRAKKQSKLALSRLLAAQALLQMDAKIDLALLLSTESTRIADTVEGRAGLLLSLQKNPRLFKFFHGHEGEVSSVSFSPDGKILASGSQDSTVRLWDVSLESWQAQACHIANRNLTLEEWRQYMGDAPYCKTCPDLPPGEGAEIPL